MKPADPRRLFDEALALHRQGKLAEAMVRYDRLLAIAPRHADARHLRGVIEYQKGNADAAVRWIDSAIALNPRDAFYHNNLGEAYRAQGRITNACDAYKRALELNPRYMEAWNNLGIVLESLGDTDGARQAYERAVRIQPAYFEAIHNLGVLRDRLGDGEVALEILEKARTLAPQSAQAHASVGTALQHLGRNSEAIAAFDRALELDAGLFIADYNRANALQALEQFDAAALGYAACLAKRPDFAEAHNNCGHVLLKLKQTEEALNKIRRALELNPRLGSAWNNLGICLMEIADYAGAREALDRAIEINPGDFKAYSNLAVLFQKQERYADFFSAIRKTLELKPNHVESWINYSGALSELAKPTEALQAIDEALTIDPESPAALVGKANILMAAGRNNEAVMHYERALRVKPDHWRWQGNYLYALNTISAHSAADVARRHREVGSVLEQSLAYNATPRSFSAHGRLRVGFVSPDLREHSVARFVEPLWRHHDRESLEFYAYSDLDRPDRETAILKPLVAKWRDIVGMSDAAVRRLIVADNVDILIDLAGHTRQNRLRLFAQRPAPIQATWLGYPNTTGLRSIDFRLTDAWADPPGQTDAFYSERVIRLDGPAWCYQAPLDAPEVGDLPALRQGYVTFCSFNNPVKYSDRTVELWSAVLAAVPSARMLLKGKPFSDPAVSDRFRARFTSCGVRAEQLEFRGWTKRGDEHFAAYHEADIALDTFPYHGTTTTCESLWMGVPVVTRAGDAHASRVGVSLLTHVGLPEMIAHDDAEFVKTAARLAGDWARLKQIRGDLRGWMRDSILMNGPDFARRFAHACAQMAATVNGRGSG